MNETTLNIGTVYAYTVGEGNFGHCKLVALPTHGLYAGEAIIVRMNDNGTFSKRNVAIAIGALQPALFDSIVETCSQAFYNSQLAELV